MLCSSAIRPPPFREPNSSRNITGKASEKKAENGLRRNSLFWARNCRHSSDGADGRPGGGRGPPGVVPRGLGGAGGGGGGPGGGGGGAAGPRGGAAAVDRGPVRHGSAPRRR